MFGLFGNKGAKSPQERVEDCQKKQDWAGLAKAYYDLGREAMDHENPDRAVLWLHRADTIYSARDDVYDKVGEALVDDCSDRIGTLESAPLIYNQLPEEIEARAEELAPVQARVWGLLSLARLVRLGQGLAGLPGCEVLGNLGWAVDTVLKSLQAPPTQEEFQQLKDLCNGLYALGDSPAFWGTGSELPVPGQAPFQVFDLNGMMGVHQETDAYLDSHLRMIMALVQDEEPPHPETGIIGCTLLPDYYVRTDAGRLEKVPQIQAELARIQSDYEFVCSGLTWEQVAQRVEEYKALDILSPAGS